MQSARSFYSSLLLLCTHACVWAGLPPGTPVGWGSNGSGQTTTPAGLTNAVQIVGGESFSVALRSDGTVTVWGSASYLGSPVTITPPAGLNNVAQISAFSYHIVALKKDGTVVSWGLNNLGQTTVPPTAINVVQVAAGLYHTCALKQDGTVVCWGSITTVPDTIQGQLRYIASGGSHMLGLTTSYSGPDGPSSGNVVAWGDNSSGQATVPVGLSTANVVQVVGGLEFSMALTNAGNIIAWGRDQFSQVSSAPTTAYPGGQIAAGYYHGTVRAANGTVNSWGYSSVGLNTLPADPVFTSVAAGGYHNLGLRSPIDFAPSIQREGAYVHNQSNAIYRIVVRNVGRPANGTVSISQSFPPGITIAHVNSTGSIPGSGWDSCSWFANSLSCSTNSGNVEVNGILPIILVRLNISTTAPATFNNTISMTFTGDQNSANNSFTEPTPVVPSLALTKWGTGGPAVPSGSLANIASVCAGYLVSAALRADGTVVAWGSSFSSSTVPSTVLDVSGVVAISCGDSHVLALTNTGTVASFGAPLPAGDFSNAIAISARGFGGGILLRSNGSIFSWGAESAPVILRNNAVAVDGGVNHYLVLLADGTVTAYGDFVDRDVPPAAVARAMSGGFFVSGAISTTGSPFQLRTPTGLPAGETTLRSVKAGDGHFVALRANGTVVAWGSNSSGEATVPSGLTNVVDIEAGGSYSFALTASNSIPHVITTNPSGLPVLVDGSSFVSPVTVSWTPGTTHTLSVTSPISSGPFSRNIFVNWSDGGVQYQSPSGTVVAPSVSTTFTATFITQHQLRTFVSPSGSGSVSVSPVSADGFYTQGSAVTVTASAASGYTFNNWTGSVSNAANPLTFTMTAPRDQTANFFVVSCIPVLSGTGGSYGAGSVTGASFNVTIGAACNWAVSSSAPWVSITNPPSLGTGSRTVTFNLQANPSTSARTAFITAAGRVFTVTQAGVACSVNFSPAYAPFPSNASTGQIFITPSGGACNWELSTATDWIRINDPAFGANATTASYTVSQNNSLIGRSGSIQMRSGGTTRTLWVEQNGNVPCTYSFPSSSIMVAPNSTIGATFGNMNVVTQPGCNWTPTTSTSWIFLSTIGQQSGTGILGFGAGENTGSQRIGTIKIGASSITVAQQAAENAFSCRGTTDSTTWRVNAEGIAEPLKSVTYECSGTPPSSLSELSLLLDTHFTNTITNPATQQVDALLTLSNAAGTTNSQPVRGRLIGYNRLVWSNINLGAFNPLRLTFSNLRGAVAVFPGRVETTATLSIANPNGSIQVDNARVTVATAAQSLRFQVQSPGYAGQAPNHWVIPILYEELNPSAFRTASGGLPATRLRAQIRNIPPGVEVWSPVEPFSGSAAQQVVVAADGSGNGQPTVTMQPGLGYFFKLPVTNGVATTAWDVLVADPNTLQSFTFPILFTPGDQSLAVTIEGTLSPVSTSTLASVSAPIPRYLDPNAPVTQVNLRVLTDIVPINVLSAPSAKTPSRMTAAAGSQYEIRARAENTTQHNAGSMTVSGRIPGNMTPVSCVRSDGTACPVGPEFRETFENVGSGETRSVRIGVTLNTPGDQQTGDVVTNVGSNDKPDSNLNDNQSSRNVYDQINECAYTITRTSPAPPTPVTPFSIGVDGVSAVYQVAVNLDGCNWQATSTVNWLRVTSGASGNTNGEVRWTADPNPGPPRSASLAIAGQLFAVNQAGIVNQPPVLVPAASVSLVGSPQTLSVVARDPNGASDIKNVYFVVNVDSNIAPPICYGYYSRAQNAFYLFNDALDPNALLGPLTPGSASSIKNSQCEIFGTGSSATPSGTDVSVNVRAALLAPFSSTSRKIYWLARDNANVDTPLTQTGTWTHPIVQTPPAVASGSPSQPVGSPQTFNVIARDGNGFADIVNVYFLVNTNDTIPAGSCHGYYNRSENNLYLYNDSLSQVLGPQPLGSGTTLSNGQCSIDPAASSASGSGSDLTLNLRMSLTASYASSPRNVYFWVKDSANNDTGWVRTSTWTHAIVQVPPQVVSGSPVGTPTNALATFAFTGSDGNGAQDIQSLYFLVNSDATIPVNTCHGFYNRATNSLYLYNDALTVLLGPLQVGAAGSLANSQCTLYGPASSVSASGNTLTLNLNIGRNGSYASAPQKVYLWVKDNANNDTGWVETANWGGTVNPLPQVVSGSPSASSVSPQTFTFIARDGNGAADIQNIYFLVNPNASIAANTCHGFYNRMTNAVTLYNDTLTGSVTLVPGGTAVANSQCGVSAFTAASSGTDITLTLTMSLTGSFAASSKNVYLWVKDNSNNDTGWVQTGTWAPAGVVNSLPSVVSGTPSNPTGSPQTFTFVARDGNGASDIQNIYFLVNSNTSIPVNTCHGYYNRVSNSVSLYNDALNALVTLTPGGSPIGNSQCGISSFSAAAAGNDLTLNLVMNLNGTFAASAKNVYLWVKDNSNNDTGWVQTGTWGPAGGVNPLPSVVSGTPSNPTGSPQTFTFVARDGNGASDIQNIYFLVNSNTSIPVNTCHGYYNRVSNSVSLYNDALNALVTLTPGGSPIGNSQCGISSFSAASAGSDLTLNLVMSLNGTFAASQKNVYLWVKDNSNNDTGWVQTGTWSHAAAVALPSVVSGSPASASLSTQNFTFVARDGNGHTDIQNVYFLIAGSPGVTVNGCHGFYNRALNSVYLYNDALTVLQGPMPLNTAGVLSNGACSVSGGSATGSGTDLTLNLKMSLLGSFAATPRNVYLWVKDNTNNDTGWVQTGSWSASSAPSAPNLVAGSPFSAQGLTQTISLTGRSGGGFSNIFRIYFVLNSDASVPQNSCHGFYDLGTNQIYLYSDNLTLLPPVTAGSAGSISNSQCAINAVSSTASGVGSDLTVRFAVTRKGSYATGNRNVYGWVKDKSDNDTGWIFTGTWAP